MLRRSLAAASAVMTIATLRLFLVGAYVAATNLDVAQRIVLLADQQRWVTMAGFVAIWSICLVAIVIAAFQPNAWVRAAWAIVIAATTAVAVGFRHASDAEFGVFDAVSLWNARHEASRAAEFYGDSVRWTALVFLGGFCVLMWPSRDLGAKTRSFLRRASWAPALPVVVICAIIWAKEGGGAHALPSQFAPLSVGVVSGASLAVSPRLERRPVAWTPRARKIRNIVLIVDESIRADYIDWRTGNPFTPELAGATGRIIDFGPAASGGNCSHYSNAILRFAGTRNTLGAALMTNPTLWQFAKKAEYRTVFVDAQAGFVRNAGKLQNFMTAEETRDIDRFHTFDETIPAYALDDTLLDSVIAELRSDAPVFIYANKNGAHFPYDRGYPASEAALRPTMTEASVDDENIRANSYRNVIKWSVDRFFKRLLESVDLSETVVIYTSDHGQALNPRRFTHCSVEEPDPREALVPLFAVTGQNELRERLLAGAALNRGRAGHFAIAPTLLNFMGYDERDIASLKGASLLERNDDAPVFTTGDIFGLFSRKIRWHAIDLDKNYLERPVDSVRPTAELDAR